MIIVITFDHYICGTGHHRNGGILDRDGLGMGDGIAADVLSCPGAGQGVFARTTPRSIDLIIPIGDQTRSITVVRSGQIDTTNRCNRYIVAFNGFIGRHGLIPGWRSIVNDGNGLVGRGRVPTGIFYGPGAGIVILAIVQTVA